MSNVKRSEIYAELHGVEVVDGEGDDTFAVPVQGNYNVIRDANVNYAASERLYTMTLVLGRDQVK